MAKKKIRPRRTHLGREKPALKKRKIAKKLRKKILVKNRKLLNIKRRIKERKRIIKPAKKIQIKKFRKLSKKNKIHLKKPIKKVIKSKKNILPAKEDVFSPKALFKTKIKVIGIGGGGSSIVSELGKALEKATFVIADTDFRALKKKSGIRYFWFGQEFTHGLGTGVNPEIAKLAAQNEKEKIKEFFKGQDIVVFIASLGGGLGSGATEVFAELAKESNVISFGIFTLPFKFEGKKKDRIAKNALKKIKRYLNVSIAIPNEKIFKVIDNNTPIIQAFSLVNRNLADSLESLIDLIYSPGLINIDFADVRTVLSGRGNSAFLNSVESSGKNRTEELIKKIVYNPLYQNNNFTAEKILFNISGDNSLSMFEVEKISQSIANINPKAKIIFGVSKNSKLKRKIKATLLMAGPSKFSEIPLPSEDQEKKEEKPLAVIKKEKAKKTKKPAVKKKEEQVPFLVPPVEPLFNIPIINAESLNQEKINSVKKTIIRRSALEIKKAEQQEEDKKTLQEKEWEIPAFLRRVKFKS